MALILGNQDREDGEQPPVRRWQWQWRAKLLLLVDASVPSRDFPIVGKSTSGLLVENLPSKRTH
jgi:hypothetical protein